MVFFFIWGGGGGGCILTTLSDGLRTDHKNMFPQYGVTLQLPSTRYNDIDYY